MQSLYDRDLVDPKYEDDDEKLLLSQALRIIEMLADRKSKYQNPLTAEDKSAIEWLVHKYRQIKLQEYDDAFAKAFKEVKDILYTKPIKNLNDDDYERFRNQCRGIADAYADIEQKRVNRPK